MNGSPARMVIPQSICGGNILPSSFFKLSTAADKTILQAGANELPLGISTAGVQESIGSIGSSTYAGTSGKSMEGYGDGDICLLKMGTGGCTAGDDLVSSSTGLGLTAPTTYPANVGAKALNTVLASEYALVQVRIRKGAIQKLVTVETAVDDTATVTAAQLLTGVLQAIPTGAATFTLPTAALLVAALPGMPVGYAFEFTVVNNSAGANDITVAAGSGGTDQGNMLVAQNFAKKYQVVLTNITGSSEAYLAIGLGPKS